MSKCAACVPGTFGNRTGLSACEDCRAGTVSLSNGTTCDHCIPGSIAPRPRMDACQLCQVGSYINTSGALACIPCSPGLSTQGLEAGLGNRPSAVPEYFDSPNDCEPYCREGKFSIWGVRPAEFGATCHLCPAGYYNNQNASTHCAACDAGKYSREGAIVCIGCGVGTISHVGQSSCSLCEAGTYAARQGLSVCSACGLDTFAEARGSSVCSICPAILSEGLRNTLYLKDCREFCKDDINGTLDVNYALATGLCCRDAQLHALSLEDGIYSVAKMEQQLNAQVFCYGGVALSHAFHLWESVCLLPHVKRIFITFMYPGSRP